MSAPPLAGTPTLASLWMRFPANVLMALFSVACCVLLLAPTARSLHVEWTDFARLTYTHGYLIAALSLLALLRAARSFDRPAPDWRIALLLLPAGLCWLVALRSGIELLHQLMLPAIAFVVLAATFGLANARKAWFAFAYIYFATSIWDVFNGTLQKLSVVMVRVMLGASAVPVHVSGNELYIPEGSFAVDPGCSGLHFLIVALSLAVIFGELHRDSLKTRLQQVALAIALALATNWIRIYCVVLAGHLTNMQHYLVRVEHYTFGWCVFAVATLLFFGIVSRWAPAPQPSPAPAPPAAPVKMLLGGASLSLAALAIGPAFALIRPMQPAPPPSGPALAAIADWNGPAEYGGAWNPLYPHADRAARGVYQRQGHVVAAFVADFDIQSQGKELVGYGNSLFNGLGQHADGGIMAADGAPVRWQRVDAHGVESMLVWRLRVGPRRYLHGISAQLGYGLGSLLGAQRSSMIAALASCEDDCARALVRAHQLVDALDTRQGSGS
jgi:exosortase